MKRRLFTPTAALYLLLCVMAVALWACSFHGYCGLSIVDDTHPEDARWRDWFIYRGKAGTVFAKYDIGMTNYEAFATTGKHRRWTFFGYPSSIVSGAVAEAEAGMSDWGFAGFGVYGTQTGYAWTMIPMWMIALPLATLPGAWVFVRLRRKPSGRCRACGYDLRATPDRCPECGTPVSRESGRPHG